MTVMDSREDVERAVNEQLSRLDRVGHGKALTRLPDELEPGEAIELLAAGMARSATDTHAKDQYVLLVVTDRRLLLVTRDGSFAVGYDRLLGVHAEARAFRGDRLKLLLTEGAKLEYGSVMPTGRVTAMADALRRLAPCPEGQWPDRAEEGKAHAGGDADRSPGYDGGRGATGLRATLEAYEKVLPRAQRRSRAFKAMATLDAIVPADQPIVTFCLAKLATDDVILVLTDTHLLVIDELGSVREVLLRADCKLGEWLDGWTGTKLTLAIPGRHRSFASLVPADQGLRIAVAFGARDTGDRAALTGIAPEPVGPPIAYFANLTLYRDRIIDEDHRHLRFEGDVHATVDTAGGIAVARGRNLAAKASGTLLLGPVGLLAFGNAKHRKFDTRELFLVIEGEGWVVVRQMHPDSGNGVRKFAALVNSAGKQHRDRQVVATVEPAPHAARPIAELIRLAELHQAGVLTEGEFSAAKAKLLN